MISIYEWVGGGGEHNVAHNTPHGNNLISSPTRGKHYFDFYSIDYLLFFIIEPSVSISKQQSLVLPVYEFCINWITQLLSLRQCLWDSSMLPWISLKFIRFHCMKISQIIYPFCCRWTFGLFPLLWIAGELRLFPLCAHYKQPCCLQSLSWPSCACPCVESTCNLLSDAKPCFKLVLLT